MAKVIGNPTTTPMAIPDWNQTDSKKADFIKNKPDLTQYATKADLEAVKPEQVEHAEYARRDSDGNQIVDHYATKTEVNRLAESASEVLEGTERTLNKMLIIPDETEHDEVWYPSNGAVREYVTKQIGEIETSLENIIKKYDLGGDSI